MALAFSPEIDFTAADVPSLLERLGDIPPQRLRLFPPPGMATEEDVLVLHDHFDRLYELVEGTLVEKGMGYFESVVAGALIETLRIYARQHDLGIVAGEGGMLRLSSGLVRIPDVSFVSWNKLPDRKVPRTPIPALSPDLAVEVLSESNTPAEMKRKTREYFDSGAQLVWIIDPETCTADVYTSPDASTFIDVQGVLDGADVLPGFRLPLADLFSQAELDTD